MIKLLAIIGFAAILAGIGLSNPGIVIGSILFLIIVFLSKSKK